MEDPVPEKLVDDEAATGRLLDLLIHARRFPLGQVPRLEAPGVYAIYGRVGGIYASSHAGTGRLPLWVGKARSLVERTSAHEQTIAATLSLDINDFWVSVVPVTSLASATFGEALAIDALRPVWCTALPGFGSRRQGRKREVGFRSEWSSVHPGRFWDLDLDPREIDDLCLKVTAHLRWQDVYLPAMWPALPSAR